MSWAAFASTANRISVHNEVPQRSTSTREKPFNEGSTSLSKVCTFALSAHAINSAYNSHFTPPIRASAFFCSSFLRIQCGKFLTVLSLAGFGKAEKGIRAFRQRSQSSLVRRSSCQGGIVGNNPCSRTAFLACRPPSPGFRVMLSRPALDTNAGIWLVV